MNRHAIDALLQKINNSAISEGNPRTKPIVNRIVRDLLCTIEDFDITPSEFWTALNFLSEAGQRLEFGLIAAGLGVSAGTCVLWLINLWREKTASEQLARLAITLQGDVLQTLIDILANRAMANFSKSAKRKKRR